MQLYVAIAIPILLATVWLYTAQIARASLSQLRHKRICLLIAHPDDEAMFFSPALLALTAEGLGNHVKILCLSTGDADHLGSTRKKELLASASILGLRSPSDVFILDSPLFPDSMTTAWSTADVAEVLASAFTPSRSKENTNAPIATIDILITFDSQGVSKHPNHVSLYYGAREWLSSIMKGKYGWECPVDLYTLSSTNILRKYASFLDAPATMLFGALGNTGAQGKQEKGKEAPRRLLFVNDILQWKKAQNAMVTGHQSQMRWFRWGWITVGRYMVVNDLKRERIS